MTVPTPVASPGSPIAVLRFLLLLATAVPGGVRADEPKVQFDLPADKAESSLRLFSRQAGVEVLFPTDAVDGIFTNLVRGEMTAREAIDALLAGTALVAVGGRNAVALTVKRRPPPADSCEEVPDANGRSSNDSSPKPNENTQPNTKTTDENR